MQLGSAFAPRLSTAASICVGARPFVVVEGSVDGCAAEIFAVVDVPPEGSAAELFASGAGPADIAGNRARRSSCRSGGMGVGPRAGSTSGQTGATPVIQAFAVQTSVVASTHMLLGKYDIVPLALPRGLLDDERNGDHALDGNAKLVLDDVKIRHDVGFEDLVIVFHDIQTDAISRAMHGAQGLRLDLGIVHDGRRHGPFRHGATANNESRERETCKRAAPAAGASRDSRSIVGVSNIAHFSLASRGSPVANQARPPDIVSRPPRGSHRCRTSFAGSLMKVFRRALPFPWVEACTGVKGTPTGTRFRRRGCIVVEQFHQKRNRGRR